LGLVKTFLLKTFVDSFLWKRFQIIKMFIFIGVLHSPLLIEIFFLKFKSFQDQDETTIFEKGFAIRSLEKENKSC
jgi:hypothetical protein